MSRHRSSVGLRWPSKRIAALHRLPIQLGMGKRCALHCAPMAARSLRHLIGDATLASSLLFLASGIALADCDNRFSGAVEASKQQFEPAPMNYLGQQLVSKGSLNTAWSLDQGCSLGDGYKTRLKAMVNGSASSGHAGAEQASSRRWARIYLNEAYLTVPVPGEVLIDLGKKDITNGYLLFLSPMDVLRRPMGRPPYGVINEAGPSWRSSYREGSVGIDATRFLDGGSIELAAFPALGGSPGDQPVANWSSLQRSNDSAMVYAAYSANLWKSFNPKLVALSTSGRHVLGAGVSDVLVEGVVFTMEYAHASRSQVHRLSEQAADTLISGGFPSGSSVLERTPRGSNQLAAGVRINGPQKTTLIGEFYYQSDGYAKSDWDRYFRFTNFALAAHRASGFQPYLDYQRLLLSAADSDGSRNLLLGRAYLTLGAEHSAEGDERIGWHASVLRNANDRSSLLNLHLTYLVAPGSQLYLGGRWMSGGERSEFGRFGQSPLLYFGLKFSL
ncbi:hypothetical protein [Verminephrobacter eiseniae]|uniref:hypothetical protein n=1 Tax=Verminephrobacter eiseniae TaxID=364317 RepID=UPI0022385F65|nr:hypothetical protein [Verminephrobacter eiseniae]